MERRRDHVRDVAAPPGELPCASCIEDRAKPPDPFRVLTPQEAEAGPPQPVAMKPVGHYAYQITWNDGHATGIYPVERLRELGETPK